MPTLIELRPKRDLLNPNFNGYKLSLDPVPVFRHLLDIEQPPIQANTRGLLVGGVDRASYDVPTADAHTNLINDTRKWAGHWELP
uniref:Uncharacterized protein n=1 Tax=Timema cristinae TaxID=61476 RepID=A0A7R9DAW0_TIMCR|nr:unnamed protein product [Timema cristinae]